jgi:hypothetical protein
VKRGRVGGRARAVRSRQASPPPPLPHLVELAAKVGGQDGDEAGEEGQDGGRVCVGARRRDEAHVAAADVDEGERPQLDDGGGAAGRARPRGAGVAQDVRAERRGDGRAEEGRRGAFEAPHRAAADTPHPHSSPLSLGVVAIGAGDEDVAPERQNVQGADGGHRARQLPMPRFTRDVVADARVRMSRRAAVDPPKRPTGARVRCAEGARAASRPPGSGGAKTSPSVRPGRGAEGGGRGAARGLCGPALRAPSTHAPPPGAPPAAPARAD